MSIGKASDFKIYNEEFNAGYFERIAQMIDVFNSNSLNTITFSRKDKKGDYAKESFLDQISSLVSRRDTTSVALAGDTPLTMSEIIDVKLNRKIGPVAQTLDAWKKLGKDDREMSFVVGQMFAEAKAQNMVHTGLIAGVNALDAQSDIKFDATSEATATMTNSHLVDGLAKFGDRSNKIIAFLMHSKVYFNLMKQSLTDKIVNVADVTVYRGTVATLGRPVLVTDDTALINSASTNTYNTLGLTVNGIVVEESEPPTIATDLVTGYENLFYRLQAEYAMNMGVKGFKWDITNGGANPTDAALGTSSNWDKSVTSRKNLAGILIVTK